MADKMVVAYKNQMTCLMLSLLLGLTSLTIMSSQADTDFGSCSSEIELTIKQSEQNDRKTYLLYCKSRRKPYDDSAEFLVDGLSREHILNIKNRCFDRKKQECSLDYCECDPTVNGFAVKFKMDHLIVGQTFGCLVRIRIDATGNFLKVFTSNKFNGTDFIPDECNVKVIGTKTDKASSNGNATGPTGDNENDKDIKLTTPLLILLVIVSTMILIVLVICCKHMVVNLRKKADTDPESVPLMTIGEDMLEINVADYFSIRCEHEIVCFFYGKTLDYGRILDMCFIELYSKLSLVYIDADNSEIVKLSLTECAMGSDKLRLDGQPNRLSKINEKTLAVIYKKGHEILIVNVEEMQEMQTFEMHSKFDIQGILALSENNFILSDKMHLYMCELGQNSNVEIQNLDNTLTFDTARRLAHAFTDGNKHVVFIADENDKKITSIDVTWRGTKKGKDDYKVNINAKQDAHNRGLQNVRAIAATNSKVYAATSSGISVFCHNTGVFKKCEKAKDYKMLVGYKKHVEHTRGLCLHMFNDCMHMGLSCVINQQDVILVFKPKQKEDFFD